MDLTTQEQLIALYAQFPRQKFNKNRNYNTFIYGIAKSESPFFKGVTFDTDRLDLYSWDLEAANSNLFSSQLIRNITPEFESPVIDPGCEFYFRTRIKERLKPAEIGELERIAKEFAKVVNVRDIFA